MDLTLTIVFSALCLPLGLFCLLSALFVIRYVENDGGVAYLIALGLMIFPVSGASALVTAWVRRARGRSGWCPAMAGLIANAMPVLLVVVFLFVRDLLFATV